MIFQRCQIAFGWCVWMLSVYKILLRCWNIGFFFRIYKSFPRAPSVDSFLKKQNVASLSLSAPDFNFFKNLSLVKDGRGREGKGKRREEREEKIKSRHTTDFLRFLSPVFRFFLFFPFRGFRGDLKIKRGNNNIIIRWGEIFN